MNHYIDVQLKADVEMRENVLLNKVFTKFHKALFDMQTTAIGVSFPKYNIKLGNLLRIHADKANLDVLQSMNWIGGLSGNCDISTVFEIPHDVRYRTISRKQTNMSIAKLRRLIKRGSISENEAKSYKAKMFAQSLDNPYLELESSSNGHNHRRFIVFGDLLDTATEGLYDQFGLSRTATIPWF